MSFEVKPVPMTWDEFAAEAKKRGLDIREKYHTDSGVYEALDPSKAPERVELGRWDGKQGAFFTGTTEPE